MKTTCENCGIVKIPHKCHTDTMPYDYPSSDDDIVCGKNGCKSYLNKRDNKKNDI